MKTISEEGSLGGGLCHGAACCARFGAFLIFHSTIPAFDADDGSSIPEYTGLIAYSELLEHGVLQLEYYRHYSRHSLSACCNVKH